MSKLSSEAFGGSRSSSSIGDYVECCVVVLRKNCSIGLAMDENEKNVEGKPIMQSVSSYVVTTTLVHKKAAQAPRLLRGLRLL